MSTWEKQTAQREMRVVSLNGEWRLHFGPQHSEATRTDQPEIPVGFSEIRAMVPGNVDLDLIRAQVLPEALETGDNVYRLKAFEGYQFWYRRAFEITDDADLTNATLVLRGVDTFAGIWVNGVKLDNLANMFIPHELPLGDVLRYGSNEVVVGIDAALLKSQKTLVDASSWAMENNWESLTVRKPPHSYGWDIMPRALTAGLWRDVQIEFRPPTRFENVYLATVGVDPAAMSAQLLVRWSLTTPISPLSPVSVELRVIDRVSGALVHQQQIRALGRHGEFVEKITGIEYWWPKGYGAARLYDIELALLDEAKVITIWKRPLGFRTVALRNSEIIQPDGSGEFCFAVNGVDIFVKGSNWVPLDAFHSRDASRLGETLALASDLNCNMLRCWGGNVYEDTPFFEFCDSEGIMIWQDFSLACALYPQTPEFHDAMRREAEVVVSMFRNHTSLVLWAGNNEIDQTYGFARPATDPNEDDKISRIVLRDVCRRLDPYRPYLPSSPYYGPEVWKRGDLLACTEDHLWGPRDDFKSPFYTRHRALFASEIGYHGCPARSSLERMMRHDQLWPWQGSEDWLTHAVRPQLESTKYNYRIALLATQIEVLFGSLPDTLDDYVLASQISQAEALKFFIEMFRIEKGRRSGILWWNIRDGWPQISDAVVDYYGARKLAYDAARAAQSDVLVMLGEPQGGRHRIVVVNDTSRDVAIDITVESSGSLLFKATLQIIPANGRLEIGSIEEDDSFRLFDIRWTGALCSGRNHYLGGRRPFKLAKVIDIYRSMLGASRVEQQVAHRS